MVRQIGWKPMGRRKAQGIDTSAHRHGRVAERTIAPDSKSDDPTGSAGWNPAPTAKLFGEDEQVVCSVPC